MEMIVTIYLESSLRGPARRSGTGAWLVEYVKSDGTPETRPRDEKDSLISREDTTQCQLELECLISALSILTKNCSCLVITKCDQLFATLENRWIDQWAENGWVKANKKPIANCSQCLQLWRLMQKHDVLIEKGENSYQNVMQMEILKEEERRKKEEGTWKRSSEHLRRVQN